MEKIVLKGALAELGGCSRGCGPTVRGGRIRGQVCKRGTGGKKPGCSEGAGAISKWIDLGGA